MPTQKFKIGQTLILRPDIVNGRDYDYLTYWDSFYAEKLVVTQINEHETRAPHYYCSGGGNWWYAESALLPFDDKFYRGSENAEL